MLTLTSIERRALRAQAHTLSPVVMIGQHGLTSAVLGEIDRALNIHELIKVRIFSDDRTEREALQFAICHRLACAPVQHLGKLIVLWRPAPPKAEATLKKTTPKSPKRPAKKAAKKAIPGAISRHGQAIKPLSARQAREQTQPAWKPRHAGKKPFSDQFADEPASDHRRSSGSAGVPPASRRPPRSAGHGSAVIASAAKQSSRRSPSPANYGSGGSARSRVGSSHTASGKSSFQQTKPQVKPAARQPRGASGTAQPTTRPPTTRRRLGGRGKA